MRWFKHLSLSHSDEVMSELMDEFGAEGYGVWWLILEKIASLLDKKNRTFVRYSVKVWSTFTKVQPKKLKKIVSFLEKREVFLLKSDGEYLTINCPKLLKYRDEYQRKKENLSGQTPDIVRTNSGHMSGHSPDQDTDTDTDTDTEKEEKKEKKEKSATPLLSGKPDDVSFLADQKTERLRQKAQRRTEAVGILSFLNSKLEKKKGFRPVEANLKPIEARLSSGVSVEQCRAVIAMKIREWKFNEEMNKHLNPITIFRPSNFEKYLGQLEIIEDDEGEGDVR